MLELRPTCENCNKSLPPESLDAMICSFECTFCITCVEKKLEGVCPNCGGNFVSRPIRPAKNRKGGNYLGRYPASTKIIFKEVDSEKHHLLLSEVFNIPPHKR
jgi:uncharacterized protein